MYTDTDQSSGHSKGGLLQSLQDKGVIFKLIVAVEGLLLVISGFLPWFGDYGSSFVGRAGAGAAGYGYGTAAFAIGLLLLFGGLVEKPFGIPQKLYTATLGLSGIIISLAAIVDNYTGFSDAGGFAAPWIVFGASVGMLLSSYLEMNFDYSKPNFGSDASNSPRLSKCNVYNVTGLTILAGVAAFLLPYLGKISILDGMQGSYGQEAVLQGTGYITLFLLGLILVATVATRSKLNPPAGLFFFLSFPLLAINSLFIVRVFTSGDQFAVVPGAQSSFFGESTYAGGGGLVSVGSSSVGAANWIIFLVAGTISVIAYRTQKTA